MSRPASDKRPSLDVVIPVKYGSRYLPQAVASVLAQNADTHVIIVDDGAPTDLAAILAETARDRFVIVANARPPGIGGARNTGAALGSAGLLAFLDADDTWPASRTDDLLPLLGKHGEHVLAFGMVEQFLNRSATEDELLGSPRPGYLAGGMLMRRGTWESVGEFDEHVPLGEFIDWVTRARAMGIAEQMTDAVVLRRRIHGDNTTLHRRADYGSYADVVRRHLRRTTDQ